MSARWRIAVGALALIVSVHVLTVFALPFVATSVVVDRILERTGTGVNVLTVAPPREAGADLVPMENPDTVTASAWLDLAEGPWVLEASLPASALYGSVAVYAHDTDTEFLLSDRDWPRGVSPRPLRILILRRGEPMPAGEFTHVAQVSTRRAFLLMRAILQDRYDVDQVDRVVRQWRQATLRPVR